MHDKYFYSYLFCWSFLLLPILERVISECYGKYFLKREEFLFILMHEYLEFFDYSKIRK